MKNLHSSHPRIPSVIAVVLASLLLYHCANVVSPTGGPRDEDPPVIIRSIPPNYSPNYNGEPIRIYFDEFVVLKNLRQQLLVSPPLEKDPDIRIKGRSVMIKIEEELRPNTTYNIFMGDAIQDNNEGNSIPNFQYVLSTGDYLDSLALGGIVIDAFSLEPVEGVSVMLYDNIYDSVPYKERPVYFAKTNKEGLFSISNMGHGAYMIFALADNNANFLFDLPDEKIAFFDSLVMPRYAPPVSTADTIPDDSDENEGDLGTSDVRPAENPESDDVIRSKPDIQMQAGRNESAGKEPYETSGEKPETEVAPGTKGEEDHDELPDAEGGEHLDALPFFTLRLFQEADTVQRVTSTDMIKEGQIEFSFRIPFDSVCVRDFSEKLPENWHISEFNATRDKLTIWFSDPGQDTLLIGLYEGIHLLDTIKTPVRPRATRGRTATEPDEPPMLALTLTSGRSKSVPYFRPLTVETSAPVRDIDPEKIALFIQDSLPSDVSFVFADHVRRSLEMEPALTEGESYKLEILPGAFTDIFGLVNDSLIHTFTATKFEDYSIIILNLILTGDTGNQVENEAKSGFILQLTDNSGSVLQEKIIPGSGKYRFQYLQAGNYRLRLIEDWNGNGKWDTGNYLLNIQPERVFNYPEAMQIRSNWEDEMSWEIQINPLTLQPN